MTDIQYEKTIFMKSPYTRLSDALTDLPDNVYLNKVTTGSGATHLCLNNDVNYVVIVPYKSAINNKVNPPEGSVKPKYNILAVKQGVFEDDIVAHITSQVDGVPIKIMTTYDSFYKVYHALASVGKLKDFKICADEAHMLTTLAKTKGKAFNFLYKHFREFKSFVFVTATPNSKDLLPAPIRDVEFVRVVWESAEKVHITEQRVKTLADCNKYVVEICKQHLLGEVVGNAYIFYNSVNEIVSVIQKLKKMEGFSPESVNIFCADNPYNDRKVNLHLGKGYLNGSFGDFKKINFLTSANYESCDIMDEVGRTYLVVSSKRNSTALTNHLAVPQACGRLRISKYKLEAKMLVVGFDSDIYQSKYDEFVTALDKMENTAKYLIERSNKTLQDGFVEAYNKDLSIYASDPFIIINDDGSLEFNDGARLSELQVYQAYHAHMVTLPNSEIANTVRLVDDEMLKVSDESRLLVEEKVDFSRILRKYIKALEDGDKDVVEWIERVSEVHKQLVTVLGIDRVKSIGMNKTKLMNSYNLAVKFSEENVNIKAKLTQFRVGGRYTSQQIVSKLQEAYNECGIDRKAVSNDIKNYFSVMKTQVVSPEDGKRKQGFVILSDIYKEEA